MHRNRISSANRQVAKKKQVTSVFNIKNEEQENDCQINIQLSSKIIKISFIQLYQYSKLVEEKYTKIDAEERLNNDIKLFQYENNLKDQNIETFFKIIKEEDVQIVSSQFRDLFKLSELFEVKTLQNYLIRFAKDRLKDVDFKINLLGTSSKEIKSILTNDELLSILEQLLSSQIEECLQNENFDKLNISIIYRILETNQKDIKSDALYQFIAKAIDDRYVLFTFLDIASLSEANFNDLYKGYLENKNSHKNCYYQYLPNNLMYIKQLKDDVRKSYQVQNDKLNNEIKDLNSQIKASKEQNNLLNSQIKDLKGQNNLLDSQLKALKEQNNLLDSQLKKIPPHLIDEANKIRDLVKKKEEMFKNNNDEKIKDIDFKTVKLILSDFGKRSSNVTPLYLGCEAGNIEVVKYILSEGTVDINAKYTTDKEQNTALTRAIINNKLEIVKLLLKNDKIDPNIKSYSYSCDIVYPKSQYDKQWYNVKYSEKTPLYLAVEKGNIELVQILLSCPSVDINLESLEKKHHLSNDKYHYNLQYYIKNPNHEPDYQQVYQKTPLYLAIEKNNIKIIQLLLEHPKIDINMHSLCNAGKYYENCYYDQDYNAKQYQKTALFLAIENKSALITQLLIAHPNVDINAKSKYKSGLEYSEGYEKTALCFAVEENNMQIFQILLAHPSIDVNLMSKVSKTQNNQIKEIEKTALAFAIEKQNIDIIQYLLSCTNINVNIIFLETEIRESSYYSDGEKYESKNEKSSLFLSIDLKNVKIAQLLVANPNIDINIKCTRINKYIYRKDNRTSVSESFETALHYAISHSATDIIKLLLNNEKIDVNIPNNSGKTPLNLLKEEQIIELIHKIKI